MLFKIGQKVELVFYHHESSAWSRLDKEEYDWEQSRIKLTGVFH